MFSFIGKTSFQKALLYSEKNLFLARGLSTKSTWDVSWRRDPSRRFWASDPGHCLIHRTIHYLGPLGGRVYCFEIPSTLPPHRAFSWNIHPFAWVPFFGRQRSPVPKRRRSF